MIFAELVEAGRFTRGKSVEECSNIVLVNFGLFCEFICLIEIGLGSALKKSAFGGLTGESCDVFLQHIVSFFPF
jgi:hypothetical protein